MLSLLLKGRGLMPKDEQWVAKLVETLYLKGHFLCFMDFKRGKGKVKLSLLHPLHKMLCRYSSYQQKTTKTPTVNGVVWGGVSIFVSLKLPSLSSMSQQLFCRF